MTNWMSAAETVWTFDNFSFTVVTAILVSTLFLVVGNLDSVKYLLTARRLHQHLNGNWIQYHMTTDTERGEAAPLWVRHDEELTVSRLGHVRVGAPVPTSRNSSTASGDRFAMTSCACG